MMMGLYRQIVVGSVAAVTLLGTVSLAQEVEPPFTWKGKGLGSFIAQDGINEISFNLELAVDADGGVKGKTISDEGESTIKHMFYGERVEHEFPGYYSRKAILVLMINEQGTEPMLAIFNGRLLAGRFFTGEALLMRSEPDSETDKALGVGNPIATRIEEDNLPSSLKSALKKAIPFGTVKIEGAYQE
jgi:hypothetical protein